MLQTCDSTFVYPEHYKKHLRIHSGDKVTRSEEGILFQTLNNAAFFFSPSAVHVRGVWKSVQQSW